MGIKSYIKEDERINWSMDNLMEQMSGEEIARELGITRQAVSNTLKRALKKMFIEFKKLEPEWGDFETAVAMSQMLRVNNDEMSKFFKMFPPEIKKKIELDAEKFYHGKEKKE